MNETSTIREFTDLDVWKLAHEVSVNLYQATKRFPSSEVFGLTSQMRRAAVSIGSNIAEGFGRRTKKDKGQFFSIGLGSLYELQSQLFLARDVGLLSPEETKIFQEKCLRIRRMLLRLITTVDQAVYSPPTRDTRYAIRDTKAVTKV